MQYTYFSAISWHIRNSPTVMQARSTAYAIRSNVRVVSFPVRNSVTMAYLMNAFS